MSFHKDLVVCLSDPLPQMLTLLLRKTDWQELHQGSRVKLESE